MDSTHWHRPIALPTLHGKHALIAPVLEAATGCTVLHVADIDTDRLGSFTRLVPRAGSQLQAARAKARAGLAHTGLQLAVASEGAFVPDPFAGVVLWDIEIVLLLDEARQQEIVGMAQGPARAGQATVRDAQQLLQKAAEWGFPEHQLCVRPDHSEDPRVQQGLASTSALLQAFAQAQQQSRQGAVFVESDLRAHCNPTRQALIQRAAQDLCSKMLSACPACGSPGFSMTGHRAGRPCRGCGAPTREPVASRWSCAVCQHTQERTEGFAAWAEPGRCDHCNP